MRKFIISTLTGITTVIFYFLLDAYNPDIGLSVKAVLVAFSAGLSFLIYTKIIKKS